MKILFVISEVEDIIKTGGLADVGKALPIALKNLGHEVVLVLPNYKQVADSFSLVDAMPEQVIHINHQNFSFGVKELDFHGIKTYLIDHPYFSQADTPYGDNELASNAQRFSLFSISALCVSANINFAPDVLHCNDWHTSMAPYFMHSGYLHRHNLVAQADFFAQTKSVITLHNAAFQGIEKLHKISLLDHEDIQKVYIDNDDLNMLKTGIMFSNKVCAVSPTYAKEIFSVIGSHGICDVINQAPFKVSGVLNGCDYTQWDPETDSILPQNYTANELSGKSTCKAALQKESGLPVVKSIPVIGMVCRATRQKGFDFIMPILSELLEHKVQLVIMGTGDKTITSHLREISQAHPEKFSFVEDFRPDFTHLIEAGADFFLMPSEFEPCGLNQMYSLAYGTLPIVRNVGGLADTVIDYSLPNANGFAFDKPESEALLATLRRALLIYNESPARIKELIKEGMNTRFTWEAAAKEYEKVYLR
ncbi:glycogen synthase [Glaciecola petra]|uniref:Glycogen synthase n=1 Tax=Glaciecola petra TaxID=3075602 RepID=A0ABU2ZUL1_9ALTE|nr:glycogen synthase [Aestuariibacter sp. P117]MDT0596091.1 glycogen synthase [Aestuariibacter sp. P117]